MEKFRVSASWDLNVMDLNDFKSNLGGFYF